MGLFTRKSTAFVSSVIYPLGEDGAERTDMLKTTVLNSILQQRSIGESIQQTYLRGQGMSLRNAFAYARDEYTDGLPTSTGSYTDTPDTALLTPLLQAANPGTQIAYITTMVGTGEFTWWAERYLADTWGYDSVLGRFESPPKGVEIDANVAYDLELDGTIRILMMNADGAIHMLTYQPTDYIRKDDYVYSVYQTKRTFEGGTTTSTRPAEVDETDSTTYASETVMRTGATHVITDKTVVSISGSTATVTVIQSTEVTSRPKYFLYHLGDGVHPELDALVNSEEIGGPYFPSIPLRVNNVDWTDDSRKDEPIYKTSEKLLKKLGLDFKELGEKIQTNESVNDIDYCFVTLGMRLNTDSPEGKQYLFRYFSYLRSISAVTSDQFDSWVDEYNSKTGPSPGAGGESPSDLRMPPTNTIKIYSEKNRADNHDIKLSWQYIDTQLKSGVVKAGARPGDVEISTGSQFIEFELHHYTLDASVIAMRRQVDENTYEELTISGLTYADYIYKGHYTALRGISAILDPEENGFLIPLNQEIIRATPLVELTNLAHQCMYLVFNCYELVKQKWYQTALFRLVIVIIAILIIIFTWGAGTPAAAGMIGVAFGVVGTAITLAMVLAATVYVLGMMVLMTLLMDVASKAFGPTWGAIIVVVLAVMSSNYSNTGSVFGTTASNASLISAQNVIQASSALATAYIKHELVGVSDELTKLNSDYKTGMAKVEELTEMYLGTNLDVIDVQGFTEAAYTMNYEAPSTFLSRTLLTGSDVCSITSGLVENFADVGLSLPTNG